MIPLNLKNNEFILNRNVYDTIRKDYVLHKNSEYKNEINITENTEKKDFIQNLEVIKKNLSTLFQHIIIKVQKLVMKIQMLQLVF